MRNTEENTSCLQPLNWQNLFHPKVYVFLVLGAIAICNKRVISPVTILEGGLAAES